MKIMNTINVHFRRMIRTPVHLTHESIHNMFHRLDQPTPWAILQDHNSRLRRALAHERQQTIDRAMDTSDPPDVIVQTPEYPINFLETPSDATQPHDQACMHRISWTIQPGRPAQMPYALDAPNPLFPEDVYNPLRDSDNGTNVCRHCRTRFSNMIALRTHINKHICTTFDLGQALAIPIISRIDVIMHLRICHALCLPPPAGASQGHDPTLPRSTSGKIWPCQYPYEICSGFSQLWQWPW